ncbi:hypothetical protein ACTHGU_19560 [Chitinophagaceae bacterium MMS25-I14]
MLKNATSLLACMLLICMYGTAQPLAAYVNLQNQVMAWDNGLIRKIDYLPPTDMKIGRIAIPYLDNSRSFKIYYGGGVKTVNIGFTNSYQVTDNLVTFQNAKSLNVFDHGNIKNLSGYCIQYYIGDSVVLFLDGVRNEYKAYYNGAIYPIENFLAGSAIDTAAASGNLVKVSDNIVAYVNYANQFRIFWHGALIPQEEYLVNGFDVGRNTVAYIDANRQMKVFQNGRTRELEDYPPTSYAAGDNLAAYVSSDGYFKIYYNDSVYKIGYFTPDYQVVDNLVTFQDPSGYFKVFYKGEITTLESYVPTGVQIKYNSLAYINRANVLRMFSEGEVYDVTSADLDHWQLNYDVLQYQIGQNMFRIYYKGTEYE